MIPQCCTRATRLVYSTISMASVVVVGSSDVWPQKVHDQEESTLFTECYCT